MTSTIPLSPSHSFSVPDLNHAFTDGVNSLSHTEEVCLSGNNDVPTMSYSQLERSEKKSTTKRTSSYSSDSSGTRIVIKLSRERKDVVGNENVDQRLGERKGDEVSEKEIRAVEGKEKKEKKRRSFSSFSVSLTREKIEADLLAMGGGSKRTTRRGKKRTRSVQRELDNLFPGMRLKFISPDHYKVADTP